MAFAGGRVEPTAWWWVRCAFIDSRAKIDGYLVIDANDVEYLRLHRRQGSVGKEKNASDRLSMPQRIFAMRQRKASPKHANNRSMDRI